MSKQVLHDEEIVLCENDMKTLNDGMWVNDTILYFQIRVIERKYSEQFKNRYFYCYAPQVCQIIQTQEPSVSKFCLPKIKLEDYKLLFFPITDVVKSTMKATHYSLFYIDNRNGDLKLKHYDSQCQANSGIAHTFANLLKEIFQLPSTDVELLKCTNQQNGYDCGIYIMAYMDALIEKLGDHAAADKILTPSYTAQYRKNIREYIPKRAKELEEQKK